MGCDGRNTEDGWIHLLAGIGAGVILGSVIALLAAPQAGTQTRDQLRETAEEGLTRLRHSIEELRSRVEEIASRRDSGGAPAPATVTGVTDQASAS